MDSKNHTQNAISILHSQSRTNQSKKLPTILKISPLYHLFCKKHRKKFTLQSSLFCFITTMKREGTWYTQTKVIGEGKSKYHFWEIVVYEYQIGVCRKTVCGAMITTDLHNTWHVIYMCVFSEGHKYRTNLFIIWGDWAERKCAPACFSPLTSNIQFHV